MTTTESPKNDFDLKMRLAADRVLRAVTLRRQAKVAVLASVALSVAAAIRPDLLPRDLIALRDLLNVGAISGLLKDVAEGEEPDDENIAKRMEALLPLDQLDRLATGQNDLLRALTRQATWQQQMLRLQEGDSEAGARLLAGLAEMGADLAGIRDALAGVATREDVARLDKLIREEVLARLSEPVRAKYLMSGNFQGATIFIESTVNMAGQPQAYVPPPPPDPGILSDPGPLPPLSRMAYSRNPLFTGREDELRELARRLLYDAAGAPAIISTGIGGIGKTQLAVEFAHRYGRFFHGVHWISMENADTVPTEIALCGAEMRLRLDFDALPPAAQVRETLAAWAGPEPRLLIFDNCEDPTLLAEWRPKSGGARVLATSRNTVWPVEYGAATLPVNPLSRARSLALLREYLDPVGRVETDEALGAVAAEAGDLPLALALAGHYLARYKRESVAGYLKALHHAADLMPIGRGAVNLTKHDLSIRRTFAVSYERLDAADEVDVAAVALLARAACFAPGEPLPEDVLLATMVEEEAGERGSTRAEETHVLDNGLMRLLELGLLERAGEEAFRLHRLIIRFVVKEIVRKDAESAEEEGTMAAARAAVERAIISLAYPQNTAGDPRALRAWEAHLRYVADAAFEREDETAATLCNLLGYYLNLSGDLAAARPYLERALSISNHALGSEHPVTAQSLNNFGLLLHDMGDLAGARSCYERALGIRERVLGPEHHDTSITLNNLASLLQAMRQFPAARASYERALAINERVLGPEHANSAAILNNLGLLLQAMGDLAGARPYIERALAINERVLGPEHPELAAILNNLGYLLQTMDDLPAARPYCERALAINERVLGPEHPNTAASLQNMGFLLRKMGDQPAAQPYYERALDIRERVLGPEHPDTATSLNNLGLLLQDLGDHAAARPLYERAIFIYQRNLGPEHPNTATALNNMGYLFQTMGDLEAARPYYEQALAIRERALGPEHPDTGASLNEMGTLLISMGHLALARQCLKRALSINERALGQQHSETANSLINLGALCYHEGNVREAADYLRRAMAIESKVLGPDHPDTRGLREILAALEASLGGA